MYGKVRFRSEYKLKTDLRNSSVFGRNMIVCMITSHKVRSFVLGQLGTNRPLALRGHVTNASFKRCVGILPKIDRAHKNYLTPEI